MRSRLSCPKYDMTWDMDGDVDVDVDVDMDGDYCVQPLEQERKGKFSASWIVDVALVFY